MGLFDIFRKNKGVDGTYHRNSDAGNVVPFRLTVQDVFNIKVRGIVVTGMVETGSVKVGDEVILHRVDGSTHAVTVGGIEKFRQITDTAVQGENVGILLRDLEKNQVGKGDVMEKNGS